MLLCVPAQGFCLVDPYGISCDQNRSEVFVTLRRQRKILKIVLVYRNGVLEGHAQEIKLTHPLDHNPAGIAATSTFLLVCSGGSLLKIGRDSGEVGTFWNCDSEQLFDVAVCTEPGEKPLPVVVTSRTGKLFCVKQSAHGIAAEHIAGSGNAPTSTLEEGTALLCTLSKPRGVCFAGNSVVFTDIGHRAIRLLTDVYTHATILMPVVYGISEAYGYTDKDMDHDGCLARVEGASVLFDELEKQYRRRTGLNTVPQGPQGNVSLVVRKSLRNNTAAYRKRKKNWDVLGVPAQVQQKVRAKSMVTLCVENFFSIMRFHWVNPYWLQYLQLRLRAIEERTKKLTTRAFSYYTGEKRTREHYTSSGSGGVNIYNCKRARRRRTNAAEAGKK